MQVAYRNFLALGDSFTEGVGDTYPDGSVRGWADLVATELAAREPDFRYANLAVRGRLLPAIVAEQLPAAEELRPELVSFAGGGNAVLRPRYVRPVAAGMFADAVRRLTATGATVLLFTGADISVRMPGGRRLRPRIEALNADVARVAADAGAVLVDLWADRGLDDPRMWSEDRLHLGPAGHLRVAGHVLEQLGIPADDAWRSPLPTAPPMSWTRGRLADLTWAGRQLAPWVRRRLAGRSSGDGRAPKRPELAPLP